MHCPNARGAPTSLRGTNNGFCDVALMMSNRSTYAVPCGTNTMIASPGREPGVHDDCQPRASARAPGVRDAPMNAGPVRQHGLCPQRLSLPMRLFIAIDIPLAVRERLHALQQGLPNARWVPVQNMHCTLRFVGSVDDVTARSIVQAVHTIWVQPFTMQVQGVGHFPLAAGAGVPNVLWAGIEPSNALRHLVACVEDAVTGRGLKPEHRPFHGHVTLARCPAVSWDDLRAWCNTHHGLGTEPFTVSAVHCYQSLQTEEGVTYRRLA